MKVFVTGGTGFVGREILWQLYESSHAIRLLSRRSGATDVRQIAYRFRAETIENSRMSAEHLVRHLEGCDAVIHLAGIIAETGRNTFREVHVEVTRTMIDAAKTAGVKRFIHMSALGSRPEARSRYHKTKWQGEQIVRASGLDWTIFRPSVIYGRDDGFVNLLARICRWSPVIPVFGPGTGKLQPIAVEDVAKSFVGALTNLTSIGQVYDLCGPEVFTMDALYDVILRTTGRRRPRIHLPMPLARFQAGCLELACSFIGRPSPLTRDQLLMLEEDNTGDPLPALKTFGLAPASFAAGIAKYVK